MTKDAEVGEAHVYFLVGSKHLGQACQIGAFGVQSVGYTTVGLHVPSPLGRLHHIAHNDEGVVAEHLTQKVDILGGIGRAQMLAIIQYLAAAGSIGLAELTF